MSSNQDSPIHYDTIEDYMLLNAPRRAKEKPICQTLCSFFVIAFAIAAMATDELSDGDIDVEYTTEDEDVDFDCGWQHVLFTFTEIDESQNNNDWEDVEELDEYVNLNHNLNNNNNNLDLSDSITGLNEFVSSYTSLHRSLLQRGGGRGNEGPISPTDDNTETITYKSKKLCDAFRDFDNDWCNEMEAAGLVWLISGILAILSTTCAIISIWKVKNKASKLYFGFTCLSAILLLLATFYWLSESRCDEFEDLEGNDAHRVTMEVDAGVSITLMYIALGFNIIGCLISGFYVFGKQNKNELDFDYNFNIRQQAGLIEDNTQMVNVNDANNVNNNDAGNNDNDRTVGDDEVDGNNVNVLAVPKPKKGYEQVGDEDNDQDD